MRDAIVQPMPNNREARGRKDGLWQVVLVERDSDGAVIKNNPNDIIYAVNLSYDQAFSRANEYVRELRKATTSKIGLGEPLG